MTKKIYTTTLALFLISLLALSNNPVINRPINQHVLISKGITSGELTRAEAIQLKKQQVRINRTKKAARADGVITRKERAIILHKQNKASANIYRKKHNNLNR
ncbi:hypothetical protein J1N10_01705 [Carboxylicivirga sp. A043]|uniref:hypothetical protein n=1 Tax=Carboxylicivirga litoralis TaxID=2816963 RepID=UPI0021CAFA51|nr:hypothetical protein [Carboxylicivirga sp. A043]MCU4154670.1 hypothetical protein [Carboxylicivirga sp. A043]